MVRTCVAVLISTCLMYYARGSADGCPGGSFPACVSNDNCVSGGLLEGLPSACERSCLRGCTGPGSSLQNGLGRGAKAAVSQELVNRAKDAAVPILLKYLEGLHIPNQDLGGGLKISNIRDLSVPNTPGSSIELQFPNSVDVGIFDISVRAALDVKWLFINCGAHPKTNGAKLSLSLSADASDTGTVTVVVSDVSVDLGNFDLNMDNTVCNVVNTIVNFFVGEQGAIEGAIQNALGGIADTISDFLGSFSYQSVLPLPAPFDRSLLDFHIADIEVAHLVGTGETYLQAGATGDLRDADTGLPTPLSPTALPDLSDAQLDRLVAAEINNFTLDTALYTFYQQGLWDYALDSTVLPGRLQKLLDTSNRAYKILLPQLWKKFGNQNMTLEVRAGSEPHVKIVPGGLTLVGYIELSFLVTTTTTTLPLNSTSMPAPHRGDQPVVAFKLACPAHFAAGMRVNTTDGPFAIIPSISHATDCVLSEKESVVGVFSVDLLTLVGDLVLQLLRDVLIPRANGFIGDGFPIPILSFDTPAGQLRVHFENATLNLSSGVATAAVDVKSELLSSIEEPAAQFERARVDSPKLVVL